MMHKADQIVDAVVSAIKANASSEVKVYAHRRLSLAEDQDELPGISVDFGEDTPVGEPGAYELDGTIHSLLTVNITSICIAETEEALRRQLLQLRALVHESLGLSPRLGLPFVIDLHYGGANPPDIDVSGETLAGELTAPWGVRYEMSRQSAE